MATNIENITLELKNYARQVRSNNSADSFLHPLKDCLNLVFGPDRNHITNIDEEIALITTLNALNISNEQVDQGDEELYKKVLGAAKAMLTYQAIIYFPQINITNSRKTSHIIRDLYVRLNFSVDGKLKNIPEGIRTTGTVGEIMVGYCHSHLSRLAWEYMGFQVFCTGDGPINDTIHELKESFDKMQLQLLCNHINQLVCWESLEGVPFVKILEVKEKEVSRISIEWRAQPAVIDGFMDFVKTLPATEIIQLFQFSYGSQLNITATEKLEEYLVGFLEQRNECHQFDIVFKDATGEYYSVSNLNSSAPSIPDLDTNRVVLKFKNIPKRIKIIEYEHVNQSKKYPNPGYTSAICLEFSKKFRTALGRKNRDEAERAHNYTRQSLATNSSSTS